MAWWDHDSIDKLEGVAALPGETSHTSGRPFQQKTLSSGTHRRLGGAVPNPRPSFAQPQNNETATPPLAKLASPVPYLRQPPPPRIQTRLPVRLPPVHHARTSPDPPVRHLTEWGTAPAQHAISPQLLEVPPMKIFFWWFSRAGSPLNLVEANEVSECRHISGWAVEMAPGVDCRSLDRKKKLQVTGWIKGE